MTIVNKTTGWKSPRSVRTNEEYGRSKWTDIQSIQYWNDNTYAFCDEGVTKNYISDNIYISDFGFDIPSSATISNVSIRIRSVDDTFGGGAIVDDWLRLMLRNSDVDGENQSNNSVKNSYWNEDGVTESVYQKEDWLIRSLNVNDVISDDFGFVYRVRGTNEHNNKPFIYGIQVKVDYLVEEEEIITVKPNYEWLASITDTVFEDIGDTQTLSLRVRTTNNQTGTLGKIYITLSDELEFSNHTQVKEYNSQSTSTTFDWTVTNIITAVESGVGTITIKSPSLANPIRLNVLVDGGDEYKDKLISIIDCDFDSCLAVERGGGYYNANNIVTSNNTYNDCKAGLEGDNYYDAQTNITLPVNTSFEVNKEVDYECTVSLADVLSTTSVDKGILYFYEDTNLIASKNVDDNGKAVFKYKPTVIGSHSIRVIYESKDTMFASSSTIKNITVTKQSTYFRSNYTSESTANCTNTQNTIERGDYYEVTLLDSNDNPLPHQNISITINGVSYPFVTTEEGKGYLAIGLLKGTYTISTVFNATAEYQGCSLSHCLKVTKKQTKMSIEDTIHYYSDSSRNLVAKLVDRYDEGVGNQSISLTAVSGIGASAQTYNYVKNTDSKGNATFNLPTTVGAYKCTASYSETSDYEASSKNSLFVVYTESDYSTTLRINQSEYTNVYGANFTISGSFSMYYSTMTVFIFIRDAETGVFKVHDSVTADSSGAFTYTGNSQSLSLTKGEYIVDCVFVGNQFVTGAKNTCKLVVTGDGTTTTLIESSDVTTRLSSDSKFKTKLYNANTMTAITNATMYYTVYQLNGWNKIKLKTVTATTDNNGESYINNTFTEGAYLIETRYNGDSTYKASKVSNILFNEYNSPVTAETVTFKPVPILKNGWKLRDSKGNAILDLNHNEQDGMIEQGIKNLITEEWSYITSTYFVDYGFNGIHPTDKGIFLLRQDFKGNKYYKPSHNDNIYYTGKFDGIATTLSANDVTCYQGENVSFDAILTNRNGQGVENTIIMEFVKDDDFEYFKVETNSNGQAKLYLNNLPTGVYRVNTYFGGDNDYQSSRISNTVIIEQNTQKTNTLLSLTNGENTAVYDSTTATGCTATLKDANTNNPITNATINWYMEGKRYTSTTNNNGVATFTYTQNHEIGAVNVQAVYEGSETYMSNTKNCYYEFVGEYEESHFVVYDTTVKYNNGYVYARLYDAEDNAISSATVKMKLVGSVSDFELTSTTDSNGVASFSIGNQIYADNYDATFSFEGDTDYYACTGESKVTVEANIGTDTVTVAIDSISDFDYGSSLTCTARFNRSLTGQHLWWTVWTEKGETFEYVTSISGSTSTLTLSLLDASEYNIAVDYKAQTIYDEATDTESFTVSKVDTTVTGGATTVLLDSSYEVTVKDENNRLISGQYVLFGVTDSDNETVYYNRLTDSNGVAHLPMKEIGTFTVAFRLQGNRNYDTSNASATVTVVNTIEYSSVVGEAIVGLSKPSSDT